MTQHSIFDGSSRQLVLSALSQEIVQKMSRRRRQDLLKYLISLDVMSISLETLWRYPGMDVLNDFFPRNSPKKESIFPSLNSIIKQNICCLALVAQTVKILPTLQETCVQSLFLEDSPGEENDNPLHNSCLENPLNRGAWWATVHGVARVGHHWATNANTHLSFYSEVTMIVYTRNCNAEIVRICCILSLLVGTSKKKKAKWW